MNLHPTSDEVSGRPFSLDEAMWLAEMWDHEVEYGRVSTPTEVYNWAERRDFE